MSGQDRLLRIESDQSPHWIADLLGSTARVCVTNDCAWVRFSAVDESMRRRELTLPGKRYRLIENGWLIPDGGRVAELKLPELDWSAPESLVELVSPTAAFAGQIAMDDLPPLQLIAGGVERPAAAGLFAFDELATWVETAAMVRLQRLVYCISNDLCLVIGEPLPPIACQYLCQQGQVLTPAGMAWQPAIEVSTVLDLFDVKGDEWLLWIKTEQWSVIAPSVLMPLRRSSVRAMARRS